MNPQKGERRNLPDVLRELLEDPNILKVGCNIFNDRTKLMADYNLDLPKDIFINISTLAVKRRLLTKSMSLKDMVYYMLGLKLKKPDSIRLSDDWTNIPLSEEQIQYAALDSYAGILVYSKIIIGQDPIFDDFSPSSIEPGSKVNLYDSSGSTIIAIGVVTSQSSGNYRDYRQCVTSTRVVIIVSEILIPCALIPIGLSKEGVNSKVERITINDHITDNQNDLLVFKKNIRPYKSVIVPTTEFRNHLIPTSSSSSSSSSSSYPTNVEKDNLVWNNTNDGHQISDLDEYNGDVLQDNTHDSNIINESNELREEYIATLEDNIIKRLNRPPSKVKGDHLHCFKNLGDSMKKRNGGHAAFMRGLSDCFFMISKTDLESAEQALIAQGFDGQQIAVQKKLYWRNRFLRHCRRTTGYDRVEQLSRFDKFIRTFLNVRDAKTKELLITPKTQLKIDATRLAIASGYYIDPTEVNMFRDLGRDRLGRNKYACYRGTNALEVLYLFFLKKSFFLYVFPFICYLFINLFIRLFIYLFIYLCIYLFTYSFNPLFIYSFIYLYIYSFFHLFIYLFIYLLIYLLIY